MPRNVAEFHIIGNIGKITKREKVAYVNVAANSHWQENGEWKEETVWNSIICFQHLMAQVEGAGVGDLVRITGSPRESKHGDGDGDTATYRTELIARTLSVLAKGGGEER